ncbi:MAG: hypothetical protein ACYC56_09610 [Candidatus Aquicultor sp.]
MNEKKIEKIKEAREHHHNMSEMEKYFAMSWGSPAGLMMLSACFAILLLAVGGFMWLLHLANIIK